MKTQYIECKIYWLELFTRQLAHIAVQHRLNTWNEKDFNRCMAIHQTTAQYN